MFINRRTFLKGAAGVTVAATASTAFFMIKNQSPEAVASLIENASTSETDVLIIGGGIAGIMAAIRAKESGASVTMVDKGSLGRSGQTPFANGFRVFDEEDGDDWDTWVKDWNTVTDGMHHSSYLENFMSNSKTIYEELESWGATDVGFGGVLRDKIMAEDITVIERTMLTTLLEVDGAVVGAVGFDLETEEACVIKSKSVVLCTGAGAFKPNGFQIRSLTSDGDAMAYRIGGKISGKEFMDTHTGSSVTPAYCWGPWSTKWSTGMLKESGGPEVDGRGLGLESYYMAHQGLLPITNEAPQMVEGADSDSEMPSGPPEGADSDSEMPSGPPEGEDGEDRPSGPPEGEDTGASSEWRTGTEIGGASAGLGVHKCEGLYPMDDKCGTNITGLFAAGDCLSSMLAGCQYIGINGTSLAASATQGALAGETASEYVQTAEVPTISDAEVETVKEEMFAPRELEEGYSPEWVTQMLQFNVLPYYVLFIKQKDRLEASLANIEFFRDHYADKMVASNAHELRLVHETRNMLLNAEMKLRSSLYRTESRGNHYREDYPDENSDWKAWVVIEKDSDGAMSLSKIPVADCEY